MEKECPRCGARHARNGRFCSKSCANVREQTPELRARKSETQRRFYYLTPEGESIRRRMSQRTTAMNYARSNSEVSVLSITYQDTDYILPPDDNGVYILEGGDVWEEI